LLKIIKFLNLTEFSGTYLVRGPGLIIFERVYQDFPNIPVGQYAPEWNNEKRMQINNENVKISNN
jgi:hypothetical protein